MPEIQEARDLDFRSRNYRRDEVGDNDNEANYSLCSAQLIKSRERYARTSSTSLVLSGSRQIPIVSVCRGCTPPRSNRHWIFCLRHTKVQDASFDKYGDSKKWVKLSSYLEAWHCCIRVWPR